MYLMQYQGLATICLTHDPLSSLAYPMITHMYTPPVAGNLPVKTLVARQRSTTCMHLTQTVTYHTHNTATCNSVLYVTCYEKIDQLQ